MTTDLISGSLIILFLYDVSDEIRLDEVRRILKAPEPGREPAFRHSAPGYVRFARPPVVESVTGLTVAGADPFRGQLAYYDYGVVSLKLEVPFEGRWEDVISLSVRWMNAPDLERVAAEEVARRLTPVRQALKDPYQERLSEDYFIVHLHTVTGETPAIRSATELVEGRANYIAQIVRGESAEFSAAEMAEIFESKMSYSENDLLVAGWTAALLYDTPDGAAPTIQLLEYANTQLLEFRRYDEVLTRRLEDVYRQLEKRRGIWARWRLGGEAERLNTIRLEVRELTERVDNSIKFLSDMFSARLYRMAAARIGVPDYRTLVEQKLQSAGDLYGSMMNSFYQARAFILELMVVIILVIELVFLFRGIK